MNACHRFQRNFACEALQEIQLRFLLAASASGVIDLQLSADDLRRDDDVAERNRHAAGAAMSALAGAAYTYQDFSDADVVAYADALEQPSDARSL